MKNTMIIFALLCSFGVQASTVAVDTLPDCLSWTGDVDAFETLRIANGLSAANVAYDTIEYQIYRDSLGTVIDMVDLYELRIINDFSEFVVSTEECVVPSTLGVFPTLQETYRAIEADAVFGGGGVSEGLPLIVYEEKTASYTIAAADHGKMIAFNSGSDMNVNIPLNSSVAIPVGTELRITNLSAFGAGSVIIEPASGVSFRLYSEILNEAGNETSSRRAVRNVGVVTLLKIDTNMWMVYGALIAIPNLGP